MMNPMFHEIACEQTPIGELVLRRRRLHLEVDDIWEIKLNEGYLMSSQFIDGDVALAEVEGNALDVVIGGLGLGYTAQAALRDARVAKLTVIELIPQVIDWHRRHLLPLGKELSADPRCSLRQGDFFQLAGDPDGFDLETPRALHAAILIDVDHSTTHLIDDASAGFYGPDAIAALAAKLKPEGVFALWSTDAEDAAFVEAMQHSLRHVTVSRVEFATPYRDEPAFNLVYLGRKG